MLAHCHWQPRPWEHPTAHRAARPQRLERRALHARHRRQGVRARHERRAAESAQLRRHRAPVGRPLSLGADRRREARDRRTDVRRRPDVNLRRRLLARRQPGIEARRRVRRPPTAGALRDVVAVSPIIEIGLCVHALERPETRSTSGISCAISSAACAGSSASGRAGSI